MVMGWVGPKLNTISARLLGRHHKRNETARANGPRPTLHRQAGGPQERAACVASLATRAVAACRVVLLRCSLQGCNPATQTGPVSERLVTGRGAGAADDDDDSSRV